MDKKNPMKFIRMFYLFYMAFSFLLLWFDIGVYDFSKEILNFIYRKIPSISVMYSFPEYGLSGAMVVSLAWLMVLPTWVYINVLNDWKGFDIKSLEDRQPLWASILMYFIAMALIVGAVFIKPIATGDHGMYSTAVMYVLGNYKYSVIFYGIFLSAMLSFLIYYVIGVPWFYIRNLIKGDKK